MSKKFYLFAKRLAIVLGMCLCLHGRADNEVRFLINGTYYGPNVYWNVTLKAGTAGSLFDDTLGPVMTFRYETVVTVDGVEKLVVPGGTWSSNQGNSTYTAKIPLRDLGLLTPEACGTHYLVAYTRNYEGNSTVDTGYSLLYVDSYCTISMQKALQLEASDGDYYDRVQVIWNEDESGATYTLKREGVAIATDITSTSYDDKDAVPGIKYKYQVISSSGTESNQDEGYAMPAPPKLGELTLTGVPVPADHVAVGEQKDFLVAEETFDAEVKVIDLNSDFYRLQSSKLIGSPYGEVAKYEHLHANGGLASDSEGDDIIAFLQNTLKPGRGFHGDYSWHVKATFVDVKGRATERVSEITNAPVFFHKYGKDDQATQNPNWFTYWKEDGACPCLKNSPKEVLIDQGCGDYGYYGKLNGSGFIGQTFGSRKVYLSPTFAAGVHYPKPYNVKVNSSDPSLKDVWFGGPHIWGIYTVEEVVAHELSHGALDDAYYGWRIGSEMISYWNDSDHCRPKPYWRGTVPVVVNGRMKATSVEVEYCDHLVDSQEDNDYKKYGLDKTTCDTYDIAGIRNYPRYAADGDDEFLAMMAANKATEEGRAILENDWAFPGEQSCIPKKVKEARDNIGWPQNRQKRSETVNPNARSVAAKTLQAQNESQTTPSITINGMTKDIERDERSGLVSSVRYRFDMTVGGLRELRLSGVMTDLNGNVVAYANAAVSNGNVSAELCFQGSDLYESNQAGPFRLEGVRLVEFDGNDFSELATLSEFKDGEVDLRRSDFARNDAYLLDVANEIVTTNGIEVSVNAEINAAGGYEIFATLAGTNGIKVASRSMTMDCVQGTNCINVVFAAGEIFQAGIDGPYVIDNIALLKDGARVDARLDFCTLRKLYQARMFDFDGVANFDSDAFMSQLEDYTPPAELLPPERFGVFFNPNGGTVSETTREVIAGEMVGTLPVPELGNDEFLGWYTDLEEGTRISDSTVVTTNVMYHAHWRKFSEQFRFVDSDLFVQENDTVAVRVCGGAADTPSSVDVYLTWNTAGTADVDLGKTKFPLTLKWAKGEIGEKVITIPIKADKAVEGDEFFSLQLANAQGVELGEECICTVTIKDANTSLSLQNGMLSPTVSATTKGDGNWFVASGSPLDEEGLPPLYHVESPALPQGKSSTLSFTVKGQGVLYFSIRFTGDPNEEKPSVMDIYSSGRHIGTISHANVTNVWEGYTITATGGTLNTARNYSFVFVQGSGSDTHVEISNVYWDYLGNIAPSTFYSGRVYPNDPSGGVVSGSGIYSYNQTLKLVAKAFPGWTFDGWYLIEDDDETGERRYHFLTKAATASYKVDTDFSIMGFFSKTPYIRALADPANGGKVSGGGLCDKGKKVTLKATANKGFVFTGWMAASTNETPVAPVATTPTLVIDRSGKPTKDSATSTTITDVDGDTTYYACFVTAEEDKAAIAASVDGVEMRRVEDNASYQTNVCVGVYLEWPVAASALSATTINVAGLPPGLKFAAKPVTSKVGTGKAAVVVTNIPANTIYGVPTATSGVDKKGTAKPSTIKVTVTTAGKSSQTYQIDTTVVPLPAWAQGTFAGGVWGSAASPSGLASLTVAANGKVSGKAQAGEFAYTLSAPHYSGFAVFDNGVNLVTNFFADVTTSWSYKEGKKTVKTSDVVRMTVRDNGVGGVVTGGPLSSAAGDGTEWAAWQYNWTVEPWKTIGKSFDKMTRAYAILADGSFSESEKDMAAPLGAEVTGRVTLKFMAMGTVTVAGEFALYDTKKAKYTIVKASGSAMLVPVDDEHGAVFIYLTPKGLPPHARSLTVQ